MGVLLGGVAYAMADHKGRDGRIWFLLGFLFGLLALLVLYFLQDLKADEKSEKEAAPEPFPVEETDDKEWYYLQNEDEPIGPMSFMELEEAFRTKKISSTTYVWSEGMEEWNTVEECGLFTS